MEGRRGGEEWGRGVEGQARRGEAWRGSAGAPGWPVGKARDCKSLGGCKWGQVVCIPVRSGTGRALEGLGLEAGGRGQRVATLTWGLGDGELGTTGGLGDREGRMRTGDEWAAAQRGRPRSRVAGGRGGVGTARANDEWPARPRTVLPPRRMPPAPAPCCPAASSYSALRPSRSSLLAPPRAQRAADCAGPLVHQGGPGASQPARHRAGGLHERAVRAAGEGEGSAGGGCWGERGKGEREERGAKSVLSICIGARAAATAEGKGNEKMCHGG